MKRKLNEAIQRHYSEYSLSSEQLARLGKTTEKPKPILLWLSLSAAASVLLLAGYFALKPVESLPIQIATEVVYNHNKRMSPEIFSDSFAVIQKKLERLDFTLIKSLKFPTNGWTLIGGRYCSIQGKMAAQLKLRHNSSDAIYTLYQAQIDKSWKPKDFQKVLEQIDGVTVRLWIERGLLLAVVGPEDVF